MHQRAAGDPEIVRAHGLSAAIKLSRKASVHARDLRINVYNGQIASSVRDEELPLGAARLAIGAMGAEQEFGYGDS